MGAVTGPWLGELFNLTPSGVAVATVVSASIGMEVMAGLNPAARAFSSDPLGFVGKAFNAAMRAFA